MTNRERIQARIARDKARKAEKRKTRIEQYGSSKKVISMQSFNRSLKRRRRDVMWKGSVQRYVFHGIVKMKRAKDDLRAGKLNIEPQGTEKTIYERGKKRDIHPVKIDLRVIQGALCDSCITPLIQPGLIYDNPASTTGKGVSMARKRIMKFLAREVRKHGGNLWAMLYDFSGYFGSIPHAVCREKLEKAGMDSELVALTMRFIKMGCPDGVEHGVTLGSQISQDMALAVPNNLDHRIKDVERIKSHIRYMDDGISCGTRERLRRLMDAVKETAAKIGLKLNEKKTRIVKATRGFSFLKVRYIITKTGRIIRKIAKSSIIRIRKRLKKFVRLVENGKMTLDDAYRAFKSWEGNARKVAQTYRQRKRMLCLYNLLFKRYRTGGMIA